MSKLRRTSFAVALLPCLLFLAAGAGIHNHGILAIHASGGQAVATHLAARAGSAIEQPAGCPSQTCPACEWLLSSAACDVASAHVLAIPESAAAPTHALYSTTSPPASPFHSRAPPA